MASLTLLAAELREVVRADARRAPRYTGVFLSGGVDSQAVLCALREAGREPWALSFTLDDRESRDHRLAREAAAREGVPFHSVLLPTDEEKLRGYVRWATGPPMRLRGKAAIECFWPRWVSMQTAVAMRLPAIATGDGGDGYFGLSKKAMLHYRGTAAKLDEFREWYYGRPDWSQTQSIRIFANGAGLGVYMPLARPELLPLFRGTHWDDINRPKQKMPIRLAFPKVKDLPPHMNLQLGDSGIAELFERIGGVKTYNEAVRAAERAEGGQGTLL